MSTRPNTIECQTCDGPIDTSGPAIDLEDSNGTGPCFVAFVAYVTDPGSGGFVHLDCYINRHGTRALAALIHAPRDASANND